MSRMDRKVKERIFSEMRDSGKLEQDYVVGLMDLYCDKVDEVNVVNQYKRARANRLIASFKDENGVRECFTVKEGQVSTYVNISTTEEIPLINDVIGTLDKHVKGTSKSLKKAIRRKEVLEGQMSLKDLDVKENVSRS